MKKTIIVIMSIISLSLGVMGMSAFEAHIINVTAKIENALSVDTAPIHFGTVFPQEAMDEYFDIKLSQSFLDSERVDDINYMLRQKPKCWSESEGQYGLVSEDTAGDYYCADGDGYEMLPILCPFLSKHEKTGDGNDPTGAPAENDSDGINAFHGPALLEDWTLADTIKTQVLGRLAKSENDILDTWQIDFRVPCFNNECAQDWDEFVIENNPGAVPEDYILPEELEHKLFGCDLWVEVSGISEDGEPNNPLEQACLDAGGSIASSLCCAAAGDFPNTCATGACGCAPQDSVETRLCECPAGTCWNGQTCETVQIPGCDGVISGYKHDTSGSAVENWPIALVNHDLGSTTATVYTNSNGYYQFANICEGVHYTVSEGLLDGWKYYSPSIGYYYDAFPGSQYDFVNQRVAQPGELVINEIMQNPDAVSDNDGEWFELYNATGENIDLYGCVISDDDFDSHVINTNVIVPANGYAVLTNNSDPATNGGYTAKYEYSGLALANDDDEIIITCEGQEIDRVEYDGGASFPDPTGKSMILKQVNLDNNNGANWCVSSTLYGGGDAGTPSQLNDPCMSSISLADSGASSQFGYTHDYSQASVNFSYTSISDNTLSGAIAGAGLKPYATYQLKFEGKPTCIYGVAGDDQMNENIGYLGRWWNNTTSSNTNDSGYAANSDYKGGSDCITGYLVWDFVTADASGNINKTVETDNSYHVLWCGGGTCDTVNNSQLQNLDGSIVPPGFPYCSAGDVDGELERFTCGNMTMPSGVYGLKMILTEESFHQSTFGDWTAVMEGNIAFTIL